MKSNLNLKKNLTLLLYISCFYFIFTSEIVKAHSKMPITFQVGKGERLLILAPHPDDETLSAGGLAQHVLAQGGSVRSVIVTAGDAYVTAIQDFYHKQKLYPKDYTNYGELRLNESLAAAHVIGKGALKVDILGFSDGSIYEMLVNHWQKKYPEKSGFTEEFKIPYLESEEKGIKQAGINLHHLLSQIINETNPTIIVFPDVMEDDSDHSSLGIFTLLSIHEWIKKSPLNADHLRMLAYLIHWKNWPPFSDAEQPEDVSRKPLFSPDNLPLRKQKRVCINMDDNNILVKRTALAEYKTQQLAMGPFLSAFVNSTECFSQLKTSDYQKLSVVVKNWQHQRKTFSSRPITRENL